MAPFASGVTAGIQARLGMVGFGPVRCGVVMFKRTCLEERMFNILTSLGIDFAEQVSTRSGFVLDFAIYVDRAANKKIAIETDGGPWHSSKAQKKRDGFRDMILRREGWTVIRFGETFTPSDVSAALAGVRWGNVR
jgi:very-short-patch-repair endonuclease